MDRRLNVQISSCNIEHDITAKTLVLLIDEKKEIISDILPYIDKAFLKDLLDNYHFEGKIFETNSSIIPASQSSLKKIILLGLGDKQNLQADDWLKLGGSLWKVVENEGEVICFCDSDSGINERQQIIDLLSGFYLGGYKFDKYFSKRSSQEKELNLTLCCPFHKEAEEILSMACAVSETVSLARDLVNEPGNILTPEQFCARIQSCSAYGLEIEILEKEKLLSLGMHALLGVAQGSTKSPYLAIMRWQGTKIEEPPIAFVGKGITFDSGGISIKPSMHMEEMKGDMGGAAAVVGSLCLLAKRKAPVNAVGVIALAENMPDGNAQRPGDIVTSMSGVTIEINNTDAEGRLALADAWMSPCPTAARCSW